MKVKMFCIQDLHMDSWNGSEKGRKRYFRDSLEAKDYRDNHHKKFNSSSVTPECYTTFVVIGEVWIVESKLVLEESELGVHCLEIR